MRIKLKPCPNCGSERIWRVHGIIRKIWWCECSECHACGKPSKLKIIAEILWNRDEGGQNEM